MRAAITSKGGNTEFADMRQAYDALDQETKDLCEPLICEHSQMFSRARHGFTEFTRRGARALQAGAAAAGARASLDGPRSRSISPRMPARIVGWPEPEAKAFLMDLIEMATQREFVYAHQWRVGDLVMWDNRQHDAPRAAVPAPRAARRAPHHADGRCADGRAAGGVRLVQA